MSKLKLFIADVDGTLVTPNKELTKRSQQAVLALKEEGIAFAITSGRPPRGMSMLVEPLGLKTPMAAFNGGILVQPDLSPMEEQDLPASIIEAIVAAMQEHKLDVWIYRGADWFIRTLGAPHVKHEQLTVHFAPTLVPNFEAMKEGVVKIVGISDDLEAVAHCEGDLRKQFGTQVSAARSQPYYLDVTHPNANKGAVVNRLSALLKIPTDLIATIGDMPNDVLMFTRSGLSIAMGNASAEVQHAAQRVTRSNTEEGFAEAVEKYILGSAV